MQQFSETSSIFALDNVRNEALLRDFLFALKFTTAKTKQFCETSFKNGKLSAELTASCQCVLRFFQSICLKYCACHEKVMPGHTKCCTCHAKSSQQTWRSDAPKCNPSQEISARTSLQLWWTCFLYCAYHGKCIFADPLQMSHACHRFWKCYKTLTFCSLLTRSTITCACHETTSERPKVARIWCAFNILTSKCASPHKGMHFFDTRFPKVVREWYVLYILTSKCASRHNGVQFFISHLASWLRTRRFSEPTFRPSGDTIIGKTQCLTTFLPFRAPAWKILFRDFPTFSRTCIFFLLTLSLLWSSLFCSFLLFSILLLHLCFSSVHIVGSLTSKSFDYIDIMYIEMYDKIPW